MSIDFLDSQNYAEAFPVAYTGHQLMSVFFLDSLFTQTVISKLYVFECAFSSTSRDRTIRQALAGNYTELDKLFSVSPTVAKTKEMPILAITLWISIIVAFSGFRNEFNTDYTGRIPLITMWLLQITRVGFLAQTWDKVVALKIDFKTPGFIVDLGLKDTILDPDYLAVDCNWRKAIDFLQLVANSDYMPSTSYVKHNVDANNVVTLTALTMDSSNILHAHPGAAYPTDKREGAINIEHAVVAFSGQISLCHISNGNTYRTSESDRSRTCNLDSFRLFDIMIRSCKLIFELNKEVSNVDVSPDQPSPTSVEVNKQNKGTAINNKNSNRPKPKFKRKDNFRAPANFRGRELFERNYQRGSKRVDQLDQFVNSVIKIADYIYRDIPEGSM